MILWSVYRALFKTDLPLWFDELIAKPLIFVLPVFLYVKKVEKKPFFGRIELHFKNFWKELAFGIFVGGLFAAVFIFFNKISFTTKIIPFVFLALATAISEEALSRGFVLKRLYESWGSILTSSFFASILFFFMRVPILFTSDKLTGSALLLTMALDIIFSMLVSIIFLVRKNITAPILIHAFYSLALYMLFS